MVGFPKSGHFFINIVGNFDIILFENFTKILILNFLKVHVKLSWLNCFYLKSPKPIKFENYLLTEHVKHRNHKLFQLCISEAPQCLC